MLPQRILVPVIGAVALIAGGCASGGDQSREVAYRDVQIAELETQVDDLKGELAQARAELDSLRSRPQEDPSDAARDALAGTGADVEWRNGELVITLTNDILFSPGSATLTANARTSLGRVAGLIRQEYGANYVRVEGHTDSDPIRRTKNKWEDNWHLAGARARAVLHFMADQGGIGKERLSFAGYADTQPRESNASKAGKAKNRRVGIVVLPTR